jgi:glycosyltransferase involved in cell wall biosynthesis
MDAPPDPRVVLVHDWLTGMRGGEKCLEIIAGRWPRAPLFTLLHRPGTVSPAIQDRPVHTSWLQWLPGVHRYYRYLLPLMPAAALSWRLPSCDLVLSFSHCIAKSALPPPRVPHVCYCFTPMRYAWHLREAYFGTDRQRSLAARAMDWTLERLREWDRKTAARVTHFIAISRTVQRRIAECYGRRSTVIYPPVDTDFYHPSRQRRDGYYLVVSAFAPYKRLDLAVGACTRLRRPLVVIGTGQEERRLQALAGPTIQFLGWQPDWVIRDHLRRCRCLLFPGEEDFGIVPLEAQACGTPVIAFGRGGATETVIPPGGPAEPTGLWFDEQTVDRLVEAIHDFEARVRHLNPHAARQQALAFNRRRFADEMDAFLGSLLGRERIPIRRAA